MPKLGALGPERIGAGGRGMDAGIMPAFRIGIGAGMAFRTGSEGIRIGATDKPVAETRKVLCI